MRRKTRLGNGYRPPVEDDEQIALFKWADALAFNYPELRLMFAIPNGAHMVSRPKAGQKVPFAALKLKRMGMKKGVPDICLPVARKGCHALYIELKRVDPKLSTVSEEQEDWVRKLNAEGNHAAICYGADEAKKLIESYLTG